MATSRDLRRKLGRLADDLNDEMGRAVRDEARQIVWDEQSNINRVDGVLQDSITAEYDGPFHARVGPHDKDAYYAVWVEFGRKNADAKPFAGPAHERTRRRWPKFARETARDVIRRHT